jgi:hypothetical protein
MYVNRSKMLRKREENILSNYVLESEYSQSMLIYIKKMIDK